MRSILLVLLCLLAVALPVLAQNTGSIEGTVTVGDQLFAGADVTVWAGGNNGQHEFTTRTDERGHYAFANIPAGRGVIQAQIPRGEAQNQAFELQARQNLVVNFRFGGHNNDEHGSIHGMVIHQNNPVDRAEVAFVANNGQVYRTESNRDGRFEIGEVTPGAYFGTAIGPDGGRDEQMVNVNQGADVEVIFDLEGGGQNGDEEAVIFGMVTLNGQAVARAQVMFINARNPNGGGQVYQGFTNDRGTYRFEGVVPGAYEGRAMGPEGAHDEANVNVEADAEIEVNFALEGGGGNGGGDDFVFGSLAGVITDPEGTGIANCQVMVTAIIEGGNGNNNGHIFRRATQSDRDGRFSIREVPVGVVTLNISHWEYEPFEGETEIFEGEETVVEVVLNPVNMEDLEFGSVSGDVTVENGEAIPFVNILLVPQGDDRNPNGGWNHRRQYSTISDENGAYAFEEVITGAYLVRASKRGYHSVDQRIEVAVDQNSEADFVLEPADNDDPGNGDDRGGENDHEGQFVELHGFAIVIEGDVANVYLLDIDNDGGADYILNFGPADYEPENGATRPENGDEIDIRGIVAGHMEPPMVIVFGINDQDWRGNGDHGGRPGGGNGWEGADNLELVEAEGVAGVHNERNDWFSRYMLNIDDDRDFEYLLFFGEDDYNPGNGAERPEDGDFVNIIGGLFERPNQLPVIVVYQINGMLWREPGDTAQLFWDDPNFVDPKETNLAPIDYQVVKAFPNPFNAAMTISFGLPEAGFAKVSIVDLSGREVAVITEGNFSSGHHQVFTNALGLGTGSYFVRLETPNGASISRVTLLK